MKRVSFCSEFKQLSACTVLIPNNAIPDELLGKNWFAHALALTTCLVHKSSQNLCRLFTSIMQLMHNAMRKLQVWNQLLVICLNTLPRPTWGHSMHFYDQAPRPPPLIKSPNNDANRLGLSSGFQNYIYIVWKWHSKILETPPQFFRPP